MVGFCPKMRVDDEICIYFYDVLSFSDSGSGVFSAGESVCGVSNVSLEKVFQELERQSNCSFLYNHRVVEARGGVSIQVVDKELSQVLDELLTKLGLGFTFDDNLVIIKERNFDVGERFCSKRIADRGESR